jgi:quinol monooxygenase YgiN
MWDESADSVACQVAEIEGLRADVVRLEEAGKIAEDGFNARGNEARRLRAEADADRAAVRALVESLHSNGHGCAYYTWIDDPTATGGHRMVHCSDPVTHMAGSLPACDTHAAENQWRDHGAIFVELRYAKALRDVFARMTTWPAHGNEDADR